jgi:hypothetical protein
MQIGTLVTVFVYLVALQPLDGALQHRAVFDSSLFHSRLQRAINRRAASRIRVMREVSFALVDCLDQGFKPTPVLFDAPLFGALPFGPPLLFAKLALVLTHQLYQPIIFLLVGHDKQHDALQD